MKSVLDLPVFRRLLIATVMNELAWWIGSVSLALLIYRRTGSAVGAAAFFLCSQFGPALLSPLLVAKVDRVPARRALAELYALEAVIFLALAWLTSHFSLVAILALVLFDGILFVTARVLARAAWTSVTTEGDLMHEANAVINSSLSVCFMLGPALGGVLVAIGRTKTALLVNVGMFALISLLVFTAKGLPSGEPEQAPALARLREGLAYVRGEPVIRRLLSLEAAAIVFFSVSLPIEVVFVQRTLHGGASGYGVLLAVWGAGAIAGSAVFAKWRRLPPNRLIALGAAAYGVGFLVMATAPTLAVAVIGGGIAGAGNGSQYGAFRSALQGITSERWMAIVLSVTESLFQGGPGAGIILGGVLTAVVGPRPALAVGAAGSLIVAALMWARLKAPVMSPEIAESVPQDDPISEPEPLTAGQQRP
jgi:MFS family permease